MTHRFEIKHTSDEAFSIYLNGEYLMQANHDDHGWSGMESMRDLVDKVAKGIGAEVVDVDDYDGNGGD